MPATRTLRANMLASRRELLLGGRDHIRYPNVAGEHTASRRELLLGGRDHIRYPNVAGEHAHFADHSQSRRR